MQKPSLTSFLITTLVIAILLIVIWFVLQNPKEEPPVINTPPIVNEKPAIIPCTGEKCV